MKVGLISTFGARQFGFWEAYLNELGVELMLPALSASEVYEVGRQSLQDEPPQVQLALGRVLELERADLILLPALAPVAQDAWGEAFAELLPRRLSGLPPLQTLPDGGPELSGEAARLGQRLVHNAARVQRALERVRPLAQPPRSAMPPLTAPGRQTVLVIGPRALLAEPFLAGQLREQLDALGLHAVYSSDLPPEAVLERAQRYGPAPLGQQLLQGAQSLLEGKAAVKGLLYVAPERDVAHQQALQRLAAGTHKPHATLLLSPETTDYSELERFRDRLAVGASARPVAEEDR
ncbi:hypothetical protein [Deinococcus sonorensis]|uniref:Uncharacterized protein n=2 Tax=Deinococcus sonorensis TaxID=309891 RepID=A0AAU7UCT3_9DEIO